MQLQNKALLLLLIFVGTFGFSQEKITISGTISDNKNNETLIGVNFAVIWLLFSYPAKRRLRINN